jgi:hypothetical protein
MTNVVYIHIGDFIPEYLYDNLFQMYFINKGDVTVYLVINRSQTSNFSREFAKMGLEYTPKIIEIECIRDKSSDIECTLKRYNLNFRNNFWSSTILRLFYVCSLGLDSCFHIENDIMMYIPFKEIQVSLDKGKASMVKDSPFRVIPSIIYFPTKESQSELMEYMRKSIHYSNTFQNDMEILGSYKNISELQLFPKKSKLVYDGAAIGQYLGGTDPRNTCKRELTFDNKLECVLDSVGFINETCVFKCDTFDYTRKRITNGVDTWDIFIVLNKPGITSNTEGQNEVEVCNDVSVVSVIANLHIHSKQLYMFSSIFSIKITDIISGDGILGLVDSVITDTGTFNYHKRAENYSNQLIVVNDWNNIKIKKIQGCIMEIGNRKDGHCISLFVYTHHLHKFARFVLDYLPTQFRYTLYTHNSDHPFDYDKSVTYKILSSPLIKKVYAQNLNIIHEKCSLLPIGLANSMFAHGNIKRLYETMSEVYKYKKTKNVYINMNAATFPYRTAVMEQAVYLGYEISENKEFSEYLKDLAQHKYCLIVRGNGLDTHRFWEALYLGVIPVFLSNEHTNSKNFLLNLKAAGIPFIEISNVSQLSTLESNPLSKIDLTSTCLKLEAYTELY